jgi:hypothetical protein
MEIQMDVEKHVKTMVSQGRSWVFHIFVHLQEGKQLQDLWVPCHADLVRTEACLLPLEPDDKAPG